MSSRMVRGPTCGSADYPVDLAEEPDESDVISPDPSPTSRLPSLRSTPGTGSRLPRARRRACIARSPAANPSGDFWSGPGPAKE